MKKILLSVLCTAVIATQLTTLAVFGEEKDITVEIDGKVIDFDVNPTIEDGRTLVPLRKIFEEIGALVKWNGETQTVSARKNSKTVTLTINSEQMQIDKGDTDEEGNPIVETITLDVPAKIVSGRTLVPTRAVSEAFGCDVDWIENEQKVVVTSDDEEDESWKENTGVLNLSDMTFTGDGIEIDGNQITVTKGGDYTVTGTLEDGNITVDTKEKVKLRLSNASITSTEGPCIFVSDADKIYITLEEGTENSLAAQNSEDGVIYSKENIEFKGDGKANIKSEAGHGIKASDNMTIEAGVLNIDATGDGIHVNDTFKMEGGDVSVVCIGDGIDSESIVIISGGKLDIETKGEPIEAAESTETAETEDTTENRWNMGRMWMEEEAEVEFEKSTKGINAEWMMTISGGEITVNSASHAIHCQDEIEISGGEFSLSSDYEKGISAHGNLTIDGEDTVIEVTKSTEGLESKNVATINNGTIRINASDDGINATGGQSMGQPGGGMPFGGQMSPNGEAAEGQPPMPEGGMPMMPGGRIPAEGQIPEDGEAPTEGQVPQQNGEDGQRGQRPMGGGNHGGMGGFGGMGRDSKVCLIINGGYMEIIAGDDCLDANGNLELNGGQVNAVKENGTFTGPMSVIDADGRIIMGENASVIAAGKGGTQGGFTAAGNTVTVYCEGAKTAGEKILFSDESGNVIAEYAPNGNFSAVMFVSPKIEIGKTYVISVGDEKHEITVTEQNTVVGTAPTGRGMW